MDMTIEKYENLISHLEALAEEDPTAYRWRVGGLAALGYLYIFGVLLLFVAAIGALLLLFFVNVAIGVKVSIYLGIPIAVAGWAVLKALWVRLEPPEGRRATREEFPELFERLDAIREELDAPKIHEVIIDEDFNAGIVQVPLLGLFGFYRNYLLVGLPLMMSLTPEEFESVVAHELGHLSGNHSRFSGWIYRMRMTWHRIKVSIEQARSPSFLFRKFFSWFVPYFNAYSFVLARMNEYEADRCAVDHAGTDAAASALVKIHVASEYLEEEFWPDLRDRNKKENEAPRQFFVDMRSSLGSSLQEDHAEVYMTKALSRPTDLSDTHPSLEDRLEAMGREPTLPEPTEESAAQVLLSGRLGTLIDEFNQEWHARVSEPWRMMYSAAQEGLERLEELRSSEEELTREEEYEVAALVEQFEGTDEALELYQAFIKDYPDDADGHLAVGRLLVTDGDEAGLDHLKKAMELSELHTGGACELIVRYYFQHGDRREAQKWLDRLDNFEQKFAQAQVERSFASHKDILFDHGLSAEQVDSLAAQLMQYPDVDEAYLVQKQVEHFPQKPVLVLGLLRKSGPFNRSADEAVQKVSQQVIFPEETIIYDLGNSQFSKLRKAMKRVPDARLV